MLSQKLFHANGKWKSLAKMGIDEIPHALKEQRHLLSTLQSQVEEGEWSLDGQIRIVLGNIADLEEAYRELSNECLDQSS